MQDSSNNTQELEKSSSFSLDENELEKYIFDDEFYARYKNEDKPPITESIEKLENRKKEINQKYPNELPDDVWDENFDINSKIKALKKGYKSLYDYYVGEEKKRIIEKYNYSSESIRKKIEQKKMEEVKAKQLQQEIETTTPQKRAQYEIIQVIVPY